ncbi:MAG: DUF1592 domain-containing protein [Verrucomicrobiales bacterium]
MVGFLAAGAELMMGESDGRAALPQAPSSYRETILPLLEAHCFECHAEGGKKGGVAFDGYADEAALLADADLWHRVLKNVRAGLMPPPESDQPDSGQRSVLQQWIKADVFQLDPARPDPGRPVLRRLNRTEYRNTIRDLMGVDFRTEEEFPADDTGHGFDTIGEVLSVSPMLLEKYLDAARTIVTQAVPIQARLMPERRVEGDRIFVRTDNATDGPRRNQFSYYEPITLAAPLSVPHDGQYTLIFELYGHEKYVEGEYDLNRCRLVFRANGEELGREEFAHAAGKKFQFEFTRHLAAGDHQVSVELERLTPDENPVRDLALNIDRVIARGPADPTLWDLAPNYRRWFPRDVPESAPDRLAYARELLDAFATRAFRRPLTDDTTDRLTALAQSVWSEPGQSFESGIARAMEAVLASPRFIFREEFTESSDPDHPQPRIDPFSLASRLSYFLWSTQPDDELLNLARTGQLRAQLEPQFQRLLNDDRAHTFFRNFVGQWLQARDIEGVPIDARFVLQREEKPDPEAESARQRFLELRRIPDEALTDEQREEMERMRALFRRSFGRFRDAEFRIDLRRDMRRETELYFEHVIRENRPLTELIDSNYTFLNSRLARHYGVPDVEGNDLQKVILPPDSPRGGLLTQGTMLAVTSNPTRTSPVKRGMFILDNILGTPPPPAPPNVPPLEDPNGRDRQSETTLRENLERHREDPKCASCHNRMDPLGLAFENFNAMGQWREFERGQPIDPAGQLVSGESFGGARELKKILVANHRDAFHRCFIEKLLMYALGRGLDHRDESTLDLLLDTINRAEGRPIPLLHALIASDAFQRRRQDQNGPKPEK